MLLLGLFIVNLLSFISGIALVAFLLKKLWKKYVTYQIQSITIHGKMLNVYYLCSPEDENDLQYILYSNKDRTGKQFIYPKAIFNQHQSVGASRLGNEFIVPETKISTIKVNL